MTILVIVETVVLLALVVLVAGLLRSHAEILRRLSARDESPANAGRGSDLPPPRQLARTGEELEARPLQGVTLDGDPVVLTFQGERADATLLAFLSSGCATCAQFWPRLAEPMLPAGVRTVIVTHGRDRERIVKLRELAPAGVPVVMSEAAWGDYQVPGSPYFVLVDGEIRGEGLAGSWDALSSLLRDALDDAAQAGARPRDIDAILRAGGIEPGDPSLYRSGETAP